MDIEALTKSMQHFNLKEEYQPEHILKYYADLIHEINLYRAPNGGAISIKNILFNSAIQNIEKACNIKKSPIKIDEWYKYFNSCVTANELKKIHIKLNNTTEQKELSQKQQQQQYSASDEMDYDDDVDSEAIEYTGCYCQHH